MARPVTDFIHDLHWDELPPEVREFARRWLLDLAGVAAAATGTALSRIVRAHAAAQFGAGGAAARMLFDGRGVSPAGAALAGGMTIDALDAHDGHKLTKGHVGCGVLPALLAVSDAAPCGAPDGAEFLTALVLGYEIGTRAGIALHRTACDYHTSGAWVAVAAAALGARGLGLDAARTHEALGIAEYHGPRSQMMRCIDHPTMVKDGSGWGAMAGLSAAYLAADGFTGAPALLVTGAEVAPLWADLGQRWCLFEQYYKPYPVCRWAQPSVQATRTLRERHALAPDAIESIEIGTFHQAIRLAVRHPKTTEEAQYSTAYPVAAMLVRGRVGPQEVAPEALDDAAINRMADRIVFTESEAFNAAFPARRFAEVTIVLKDGRRLRSGPTEASGDPEAPAPMDEVRAKFHAYADPVLGRDRADAIEAEIDALGPDRDMAALFGLILSPVSPGP
ncbi:MmgE/PrpD family protein [Limimaricola pyoseonensis]|uniref:2-methylcitrate dehydratase PrpD n=1 Tax=Limimaricola pyoseonensis TaxID=521013 RepID=A0A1G7G6H8_9RHOB|nr:MmgE/PrpD family protein [Limimaricola pyoseonensis]SDE83728.1 2-methylcitrate dehydratase PrpD [Limimaricola pyoseonensis]